MLRSERFQISLAAVRKVSPVGFSCACLCFLTADPSRQNQQTCAPGNTLGGLPRRKVRGPRLKGIGAEILAAVAEGWRIQHEAWMVQHPSVREAVHELKRQTAHLAEILELLRSRK